VRSIAAWARSVVADPLYRRVCLWLVACPAASLGGWGVAGFVVDAIAGPRPVARNTWFGLLAMAAVFAAGALLIAVAAFGSESRVERICGGAGHRRNLHVLAFHGMLALVAFPITVLLRTLRRDASRFDG